MRTLKFIVDALNLSPDPDCDFTGLVPGTSEYLQCKFTFSKEWNNCRKVVAFWSPMGKEYPPQILHSDNTCMIPKEALANRTFRIQVLGKWDKYKILTNKLSVTQNGG